MPRRRGHPISRLAVGPLSTFLLISSHLWNPDEHIRLAAREIAKWVADRHGGKEIVFRAIVAKYRGIDGVKNNLCARVLEEYETSPADALRLWLTITRLLKRNLLILLEENLDSWLQIPQVPSFLKHQSLFQNGIAHTNGAMAELAMHYATHYCQSRIFKKQIYLDAFTNGFRCMKHRPSWGLEALDKNLAAFHFQNAFTEPTFNDCPPQSPDLKVWATLTVFAFKNNHPRNYIELQHNPMYEEQKYMELIGSIYCHWDYLLRKWIAEREDDPDFDDDAKTKELVEICEILKDSAFSQYIEDRSHVLPPASKHAVAPVRYRD